MPWTEVLAWHTSAVRFGKALGLPVMVPNEEDDE
jgi:hypothetical protein